jgi:hypothetical protein
MSYFFSLNFGPHLNQNSGRNRAKFRLITIYIKKHKNSLIQNLILIKKNILIRSRYNMTKIVSLIFPFHITIDVVILDELFWGLVFIFKNN